MSEEDDRSEENAETEENGAEEKKENKEEKPPKRWADEIDALLRLFVREGRTKFGLLLLELAWVGFLAVIIDFFKRATPGTPSGPITFQSVFGWPEQPIAVTELWLPGALIIFVYWLFASERIRYVYAVLRLSRRWELLGFTSLVFFLCIIIDALWSFPLYLLLEGLQRLCPKMVQRVLASREQKAANARQKLERFLFTPRPVEQFINAVPGLTGLMGRLARLLIRPLVSPARIGLARITDTNSEEARLSTKFSLRAWANAEQRVASLLREAEIADWVSVVVLPGETNIRSRQHAAALAIVFGLDIVVWGSYTDPRPDGSRSVHMNFYRAVRKQKPDGKKTTDYDFGFSLFKRRQNFDVAGMEVAETELKELYWILGVAILGVLADRSDLERPEGILNFWNRIDQLKYSGTKAINAVLPEMAERFIAGSGGPAVETAAVALTPVFSGWAVSYFDRHNDREPSAWELQIARETLEKCVAESPGQSVHLYRLGALYAYLNEYHLAVDAFTRAKNARYNLVGPPSGFWAQQDVADVRRSGGDKCARAWARLAATAAEILHHGSTGARTELLEIKQDTGLWEIYAPQAPVSRRIVWELLERA